MTLCEHCTTKKISMLMPFSCKCGYKELCAKCRIPEAHNCIFDYKREGKIQLTKSNPLVIKPKLNNID